VGLRERHRRATRLRVQAAALELFEERDFGAVTVEEVAAAAGVSPSTVFRHFGTKEALVLWDELDERVERELVRRLGRGEIWPVLRDAFAAAYSDLEPEVLERWRRRLALIDAEPALRAAQAGALEVDRCEFQGAIALAWKRDVEELDVELLARLALAALIAGIEAWQRAGAGESLAELVVDAFDRTRAVLR